MGWTRRHSETACRVQPVLHLALEILLTAITYVFFAHSGKDRIAVKWLVWTELDVKEFYDCGC